LSEYPPQFTPESQATGPDPRQSPWAPHAWYPTGQAQYRGQALVPGQSATAEWQAALVIDPADPAPILISFAARTRQRRSTILFRAILAIPNAIALSAVGMAAAMVAFIGWFGALFTGRLPAFAAEFLTGYLRWQTRFHAYLMLLTDRYPPFSLDDDDYPVHVYTKPVRLHPAKVLFRAVLLIPVAVVSALVSYGLLIMSVVGWLIAVVTGELPVAFYQAVAATVRFNARYYGYAVMLTGEYPRDLFGDSPREAGPIAAPAPAPAPAPSPSPWQLMISGPARALEATFVALGLLLTAAAGAAVGTLVAAARAPATAPPSPSVSPSTVAQLRQAYTDLMATARTDSAAAAACGASHQCFADHLDSLGSAFQHFSATVQNALVTAHLPASAAAAEGDLVYQAGQATVAMTVLGSVTSAAQYRQEYKATRVDQILAQITADFDTLIAAVSPPVNSA
jgi:hypothetical protein